MESAPRRAPRAARAARRSRCTPSRAARSRAGPPPPTDRSRRWWPDPRRGGRRNRDPGVQRSRVLLTLILASGCPDGDEEMGPGTTISVFRGLCAGLLASVEIFTEHFSPGRQLCRSDDQEENKDDKPELARRKTQHDPHV